MQGQGYMHMVPARLGGCCNNDLGGPRSHLLGGMGGGFTLYPLPPGNWLDADDPFDILSAYTTELPDYGLTNDDGDPIQILNGQAHGVAIDPEDFSRNWMYGYAGVGVIGVTVDWDSQTSEPMAGFGEPPNSWQTGENIAQGDDGTFFFSLQYYEGFLYMGNGWFNDPLRPPVSTSWIPARAKSPTSSTSPSTWCGSNTATTRKLPKPLSRRA